MSLEDPIERGQLRLTYLLTGPPAVFLFAWAAAAKLGAATIDRELEALLDGLMYDLGLPVSVSALLAGYLLGKRSRPVLPLWFLAAGAGLGWFVVRHLDIAALEACAYLSLLAYGLTATWFGCSGRRSWRVP